VLVHRVLGRTAEPRDHPVGGRLPRVALALVRRDVLRPLAWTSAVVRKTPGWPRSWASFSLLQLYSHRDAWANLHLLGQPNTFLAGVVILDRHRLSSIRTLDIEQSGVSVMAAQRVYTIQQYAGSFRYHSPVKDRRFPFTLSTNATENPERIVYLGEKAAKSAVWRGRGEWLGSEPDTQTLSPGSGEPSQGIA
jgi:hypothetical protein